MDSNDWNCCCQRYVSCGFSYKYAIVIFRYLSRGDMFIVCPFFHFNSSLLVRLSNLSNVDCVVFWILGESTPSESLTCISVTYVVESPPRQSSFSMCEASASNQTDSYVGVAQNACQLLISHAVKALYCMTAMPRYWPCERSITGFLLNATVSYPGNNI